MQPILTAIHEGNWGDAASIVGVLISLIGFGFTIVALAKSKSAAQQVAQAVTDVHQKLSLRSVSEDLATLMNDIEEIKAMHRIGAWDAMPVRYASIRKRLFLIKENPAIANSRQKATVQGIIQQFKEIGDIVEIALAEKNAPQDVAILNKMTTDQSDRLIGVLLAVQRLEKR